MVMLKISRLIEKWPPEIRARGQLTAIGPQPCGIRIFDSADGPHGRPLPPGMLGVVLQSCVYVPRYAESQAESFYEGKPG